MLIADYFIKVRVNNSVIWASVTLTDGGDERDKYGLMKLTIENIISWLMNDDDDER